MKDSDYWSCAYGYTSGDTEFKFHDWVYNPALTGEGVFNWDEE